MAIQVITLAQIETAILQMMGYPASTAAPWQTSNNLYLRVNEYIQRLPQKISVTATALRQQGVKLPYTGIPRFNMWKTSSTLTCSSGSATVYLPLDVDGIISFYDNTNKRTIHPVENVNRYHLEKLKKKAAGPPEAIEVFGFETVSSVWRMKATLYPSTQSGVTPSIAISYWRIPATMGTDSAAYPDIDKKYEAICIYGPIVDLSRSTGKEHERFQAIEKEMLTEMAMTALPY